MHWSANDTRHVEIYDFAQARYNHSIWSQPFLSRCCVRCAREFITRQIEKDAGAKWAYRCGDGGDGGGAELGFGRNRARNWLYDPFTAIEIGYVNING